MIEEVKQTNESANMAHGPARLVTPEDAAIMQSNLGKVYKVARAGGAFSSRGAAFQLRSGLPRWYGGKWEVASRGGEVFVRAMTE